jgi:hypothetical protein
MPQSTTIDVPAQTWTQVTNADATAVSLQNVGGQDAWIKGAVGAVPPTDLAGAYVLQPGLILPSDVLLATLFPGTAGVNRVYVWSGGPARVSVHHA